MYRQTFGSDSASKVLKDLEARCNWRSSSYVAGDANATAFEEETCCPSYPQYATGVIMSEGNIEQVAQQEAPLQTPAELLPAGLVTILQMIPEELRQDPSLTPIKDVENLARSYVNAQKLIGADKIPMPVNPTDEDLDRIYGRLGRPESPEGYQIQADGTVITEEVANNFSDIAHKLRLNPQQAQGILDYYRSSMEQTTSPWRKRPNR